MSTCIYQQGRNNPFHTPLSLRAAAELSPDAQTCTVQALGSGSQPSELMVRSSRRGDPQPYIISLLLHDSIWLLL